MKLCSCSFCEKNPFFLASLHGTGHSCICFSSGRVVHKPFRRYHHNLCESSDHTCHNTPWANQTRHCGKLLSKPGRSFLRGTTWNRQNTRFVRTALLIRLVVWCTRVSIWRLGLHLGIFSSRMHTYHTYHMSTDLLVSV